MKEEQKDWVFVTIPKLMLVSLLALSMRAAYIHAGMIALYIVITSIIIAYLLGLYSRWM